MVLKFSGNMNLGIVPASKNTTWEYNGESVSYTVDIVPSTYDGYDEHYRSFAVKSKNDIVVTTLFTTEAGKVKKITTTIKNFFAEPTANYTVKYTTWSGRNNMTGQHKIKPDTAEGTYGLYGANGESFLLGSTDKYAPQITFNEGDPTQIYDTKGSDAYKSNYTGNNFIYELAGNDSYLSAGEGTIWAYDYAGNDSYSSMYGSKLRATDYAGKDFYHMIDNSRFIINDYEGSDKYILHTNNDVIGEGETGREIHDYKGNDNYTVTATLVTINDDAGKDTYDINNSQVSVYDSAGKDTYNIDSSRVYINEDSETSGNDTFNITNCNYENYGSFANPNFRIINSYGNDTYNITGLHFSEHLEPDDGEWVINDGQGNDKYNVKSNKESTVDVDGVTIYDGSGNDKYTFTVDKYAGHIDDVTILDSEGNDIYKLSGHEEGNSIYGSSITDISGNDKYTLNRAKYFFITDKEGNDNYKITDSGDEIATSGIHDLTGNDKYTLNPAVGHGLWVRDEGNGNDTYKVDISKTTGGWLEILDEGGAKDSLTLSNVKKDDIVLMANINNKGYCSGNWGDALIAYNKRTGSFVLLDDFYTKDDSALTGFGTGRIESIKAGGTALKDAQTEALYADFNALREEVGGFLADNTDHSNVFDALENGSAQVREQLVAYFTHTESGIFW